MVTCSIEGCDKPFLARELCRTHYARWTRHGDPTVSTIPRYDGPCSVEGCEVAAQSKGMCKRHYLKQWRADTGRTNRPRKAPAKYGMGYDTAHGRVVAVHGWASGHPCVSCGGQAKDWAYNHSDPNELYDERGYAYSFDITNYSPMCRRCHCLFDRGYKRAS